jgi:acetyl-CoA C-acetyltransferase
VATSTDRTVIVGGARTPIGRLSGALSSFTAQDLGGFAIRAALERAGVAGSDVDYVIMGQVLQAGQGQITARQAAVKGGIPMDVPALTINKVCLSGLNAIAMADQLIRVGEFDVVVAGGMESMSGAPYLLPKARSGYRYGNAEILDATFHDGLFDAFEREAMGESTEKHNDAHGFTREEQDEYAARSHELAASAIKEGRFADEIVAVEVPQRKGDPLVVSEDEGVRPGTTAESLGRLKPAFRKDGTITAGNASQISDGAAAVVVMSRARAEELGVTDRILAEVGAHGVVAGPDNSLQLQPARAIRAAVAKSDVALEDLKVLEVNEAFAAVGLASQKDLGLGNDVFNPNGGAIALGHPIGASGARLALTVIHELARRGGGAGAASLCGGGGQGDALIFHVPTT